MTRKRVSLAAVLLGTLLVGGVFGARGAGAAGGISFGAPTTYALSGAAFPTVLDLDADGFLDIAVAGHNPDAGSLITVLYGQGNGSFDAPAEYPVNHGNLTQIIGADVNGDGQLDLVSANHGTAEATIVLSTGPRTFQGPDQIQHFNIGNVQPYSVTSNDWDGDGDNDLVLTRSENKDIAILFNNGDGTFGSPRRFFTINLPSRVINADFNEDGIPDLAVSHHSPSDVFILRGNGNGTFTRIGAYRLGTIAYPNAGIRTVVTADFNGDGHLDLATSNINDHTIALLYGDGTGVFGAVQHYPAGYLPHIMDAGDFDGDGDPDLAIPQEGSTRFLTYENTGDGWVEGPYFTSGGEGVSAIAVGDFNGDGKADVVVSNGYSSSISVFLAGVAPLAAQSLTVEPGSIIGGYQTATGTVTLSRPAPAGGAEVALSTTNSAATVPASVTIPEGETQATFSITAPYVTETSTGEVTATLNGSQSAPLTVLPVSVATLAFSKDPASDGKKVYGTVTLSAPAAPGDLVIALSSSDPAAAEVRDVTVSVLQGQTQATFKIKTHQVATPTTVTISATVHGITTSTVLTVTP